jgi:hypothetical protein
MIQFLSWLNPLRNPLRLYRDIQSMRKWFKEYEKANPEYKKNNEVILSSLYGLMMQVLIIIVIIQAGLYLGN